MKPTNSILASLALLIHVASASAATIVSTLGPGQSYAGSGYGITGLNSGQPAQSVGVAFTPKNNFILSDIELALGISDDNTGTNSVVIQLQSNNAQGLPGGIIESWSVSNLPILGEFTSGHLTVVDPISPLTLNAGMEYWLTVLPGATNTWAAWSTDNNNAPNPFTDSENGGPWVGPITLPEFGNLAFQVDGTTPLPEPSSIILLGIASAIGCCAWLLKRRRNLGVIEPVPTK